MPRSGGGGGRSRGSGGSYGGGSRSSFGGSPSRPYSTGRPSSSPSPQKPQTGSPGQPSVMRQVATTAAGVAAGSVLASAIIGAAQGSGSIPKDVDCSDGNCRIPDDDPCAMELRNFIDCAYKATEMTACDGYNTLLKECRRYTDRQKSRS